MQLAMQVLVLNRINLPYDKYDYKHYHALRTNIYCILTICGVYVKRLHVRSSRVRWQNWRGSFGPTFSERMLQANAHARVDIWCMRAYFLYLIIS